MKDRVAFGRILMLLLLGSLLVAYGSKPAAPNPGTIIVPDDYEKIQWAIGNASDGDIVFVRAGTYYEHLVVDKNLTLIGEDRNTRLIGNGSSVGVSVLEMGEQCYPFVKVAGFALENHSVGIKSCGDGHGSRSAFEAVDNYFTRNNVGALVGGYGKGLTINNTFIDNVKGICVELRTYADIVGNIILFSDEYAIALLVEPGGNVTNNHIQGNKYGVFIQGRLDFGGFQNSVHGNRLLENDYAVYGMNLAGGYLNFQHNDFANNTHQVLLENSSITSWDAGYPSGGNYWSDYNGTDLLSGPYQDIPGSDGFGDTPYVIDGNITDHFPFMQPLSLPIADVMPPYIQSVSRTPLTPNYDQSVEVEAVVLDNVGVNTSLLFYRYDTEWTIVTMSRSGDNFTASIPAFPYDMQVEYRVCAEDVNDIWAVSDTYVYTVADFDPPEIVAMQLQPMCPPPYAASNETRAYEPAILTANISEPVNASGVDGALFSYRVDGGAWWNTTMTYNATAALWTVTIPGQTGDSTVEFSIRAYDRAENLAVSTPCAYDTHSLLVGDVDGDGDVDIFDFVRMAGNYGKTLP